MNIAYKVIKSARDIFNGRWNHCVDFKVSDKVSEQQVLDFFNISRRIFNVDCYVYNVQYPRFCVEDSIPTPPVVEYIQEEIGRRRQKRRISRVS